MNFSWILVKNKMFKLIKFLSILIFISIKPGALSLTTAAATNNETISRIYNQPIYTPRKAVSNEFDFTGYKNYTVGVLMASNLSTYLKEGYYLFQFPVSLKLVDCCLL